MVAPMVRLARGIAAEPRASRRKAAAARDGANSPTQAADAPEVRSGEAARPNQ
jgi:hypothetical protein